MGDSSLASLFLVRRSSSSSGLEHYASFRRITMLLVHSRHVCMLVQYMIHGASKEWLKPESLASSIHSLDDFNSYLAEQVEHQRNSCSSFRQALFTGKREVFSVSSILKMRNLLWFWIYMGVFSLFLEKVGPDQVPWFQMYV